MGYQESFVYVQPQECFCDLMAAYKKAQENDVYEWSGAAPESVVELKRAFGVLPAGTKLLWVCGEREDHNIDGIFGMDLSETSEITSGIIEIIPAEDLFDFSDKYTRDLDTSRKFCENKYMKCYKIDEYTCTEPKKETKKEKNNFKKENTTMLNTINIMGRLTRNPELRYTQNQIPVASFTLAVDRDYSEGGERKADFIDCVAWRGTAEFVSKYFTKGSMAVVSGRLQIRDWTDREGAKRKAAEVIAENVYFGEGKRGADRKGGEDTAAEASASGFSELNDDGELPF